MVLTIAILFPVLCGISMYGWGTAVRRAFRMPGGSWPCTIALGMAGVVFLGGILNLLRLARPTEVGSMLAIGAIVGVTRVARLSRRFRERGGTIEQWLSAGGKTWIVIAGICLLMAIFTIRTNVPPWSYNYDDDYQKYFAHPVRMLQTGRLANSPLNTLGLTTGGGQAFLDAFEVSFFPIKYVSGVDSLFGLLLCFVLAANFTINRPRLRTATFGSLLLVFAIPPQAANISPLYIAAAFMMTAIALCTDPRETADGTRLPNPLAIALLYAALVNGKFSFAMIAALHVAMIAAFILITQRRVAGALKWALICGLSAAVFALPWAMLFIPNYLVAWHGAGIGGVNAGPGPADPLRLFDWTPTGYQLRPLADTVLVALTFFAAGLTIWRSTHRKATVRSASFMSLAAALAMSGTYLSLLVFAPRLYGVMQAYRYFAPCLIAFAPAIIALALREWDESSASQATRWTLLLALQVPPIALFTPTLLERLDEQVRDHTQLPFEATGAPSVLLYHHDVLDGTIADTVAGMQNRVPAGEPLLAWVNCPFYLNFARNPIDDIDNMGLSAPWLRWPAGVHYVVWQYNGRATRQWKQYVAQENDAGASNRTMTRSNEDFLKRFAPLARRSRIIYQDREFIIFFVVDDLPKEMLREQSRLTTMP